MSSMMSPGMHPVLVALQVIDDGLDELAEGNLWSLLDSEVLEVRVELKRLSSRLYAQRLRSTREVDVRGAGVMRIEFAAPYGGAVARSRSLARRHEM